MQTHDTEVVYETPSMQTLRRRAVVLDAADIPYRVVQQHGGFALFVRADDAEHARAEIAAYDRENDDEPVVLERGRTHRGAWIGVAGYVVVLLVMAGLTQADAFGIDWRNVGMNQAGLVRQGEVWRCVTALTLHADPAHLIGNLVFGCLFGWFAGQMLGPGLAWFGIVLAGTVGNFLDVCFRPDYFSSLGASTAVFSALGIVAAYVWSARRPRSSPGFVRWSPIIAGVVLLSFLGTGGKRTDVGAHVAGILSGAVLGAVFELWSERLDLPAWGQWFLGGASVLIVVFAWASALAE